MGDFSNRMQLVASRLLTTYGQLVTFIRWESTDYNPNTGGVDPVTSTTYNALGHPRQYRDDEIDGTVVQRSDINLLAYTTTAPEINDVTTIDSVVYRVMNVEKVNAQGETIVYRLQLRK